MFGENIMQANCPFYGCAMIPTHATFPFMLIPTGDNRCALILGVRSPCRLDVEGKPVEWHVCPKMRDVTAVRRSQSTAGG
jgi:hypothetical protein